MKSLLLLTFLALFTGFEGILSPMEAPESVVEWQMDTTYDFGLLERKKPGTVSFPFKNVSGEPILIENVRTSCGCTASEWSIEPIAPDSLGQIDIVFDSVKPGYFYKKVKVFFSGQRKAEILWIEGEVDL